MLPNKEAHTIFFFKESGKGKLLYFVFQNVCVEWTGELAQKQFLAARVTQHRHVLQDWMTACSKTLGDSRK